MLRSIYPNDAAQVPVWEFQFVTLKGGKSMQSMLRWVSWIYLLGSFVFHKWSDYRLTSFPFDWLNWWRDDCDVTALLSPNYLNTNWASCVVKLIHGNKRNKRWPKSINPLVQSVQLLFLKAFIHQPPWLCIWLKVKQRGWKKTFNQMFFCCCQSCIFISAAVTLLLTIRHQPSQRTTWSVAFNKALDELPTRLIAKADKLKLIKKKKLKKKWCNERHIPNVQVKIHCRLPGFIKSNLHLNHLTMLLKI